MKKGSILEIGDFQDALQDGVVPLGKRHFCYILKINPLSECLSATPTFAPTAHCIAFHRSALQKPSE